MIQTAQALRLVRRAQVEFLLRWARGAARAAATPAHADRFAEFDPIENPDNRDWRLLYRGSVLDD